jgi:O-antigen/teichoic acid export membrane protein
LSTPSLARSLRSAAPVAARAPARARAADSLQARFLAGAFWSLGGAIVSRGLTMLGAIGAGHLLGTAGFGELGIVQSTTSMFVALAGLGLGLTATKSIAETRTRDPQRAGRYITLFFQVTLGSGLLLSALYLLALPSLGATLPPGAGLTLALQVGAGLIFFGALNGTGLGVLAGLEAFKRSANVGAVRGALTAGLGLLGVATYGVVGGVAGTVLAEFLSAGWIVLAIRMEAHRRGIPRGGSRGALEWPVLWRFSLPALLSSLVVLPALWIANVRLVRDGGGFDQMGVFSAALKWNQMILFVPSALASIILSMLSNSHGSGSREEFRGIFRLSLAVNLGVTLVPSVLAAVFAPTLMRIYGPAYVGGWPVLVALSAASLPMVLNTILGQAFISTGSIWCRFALDFLLAATLAATAWWLIPRAGALGLAIANFVAFSVTSASLGLLLARRSRRFFRDHAHRG